jgi:2'-5' RNA ligase
VIETAVVVTIGPAEAAVGPYRRAHTPSGARGMPAHVTLMVPFTDGELLDVATIRDLRDELSRFPAFELTLRRFGRWPGPAARPSEAVLYAVPEPGDPFVEMTASIAVRFGVLPYADEHDDIVPHLTIASSADEALLDRIEAELAHVFPITTRVTAASLWEHAADGWRMTAGLPLG